MLGDLPVLCEGLGEPALPGVLWNILDLLGNGAV